MRSPSRILLSFDKLSATMSLNADLSEEGVNEAWVKLIKDSEQEQYGELAYDNHDLLKAGSAASILASITDPRSRNTIPFPSLPPYA